MKKLFFTLALCAGAHFANAQVPVIHLHNQRVCDVYVEFFGDNGCGGSMSTGVIMVPGSSAAPALTTSNYTWGGGTTPTHFNYMRVYYGDPLSCRGGTIEIGEACSGKPNHAPFTTVDASCNFCNAGAISWISTGGSANITIAP